MWSVRVVQSEQHMGGGGEAQANMEETDRVRVTDVSGSSPQLALKKGAPGDQV